MNARLFFGSALLLALLLSLTQATRAQGPAPEGGASTQAALGTAFTYQGRLTDRGTPASGAYDLRFTLFDRDEGGQQVGAPLVRENVQVQDGLFTVALDFGRVFDGTAFWLALAVRPGASTDAFTPLSPRQPLTAAPYALHAAGAWSLFGNRGTSPGPNFLGTTDAQPLILKTGGVEAMRISVQRRVGIGTANPQAGLDASTLETGGIGVLGTSASRGVVGQLGVIPCPGPYGVGGCGGEAGPGVFGTSDTLGVVGALGGTACPPPGSDVTSFGTGGCATGPNTAGLFGANPDGTAIFGTTSTGAGVTGESDGSGAGVNGLSLTGIGVFGASTDGRGVLGRSTISSGVLGDSNTQGVVGTLRGNVCPESLRFGVGGCVGEPNQVGVYGSSPSDEGGAGVLGVSEDGIGVEGRSTTDSGVSGSSGPGNGVDGRSDSGIGVHGDSNGRGVVGTLAGDECPGVYAVGGCDGDRGVYGVFGRSALGVGVVGSTDSGDIFRGVVTAAEDVKVRIDETGKGFFDGGTQTGGADYAESFRATDPLAELEPGDVLVIDPQSPRAVRKSREASSRLVTGVYSTRPAILAVGQHDPDDPRDGEVPVALLGVVPTKVSAENGAIQIGDLLVTAATPGHAMKALPAVVGGVEIYPTGAILGKALEPLASGTGVIDVLVTLR